MFSRSAELYDAIYGFKDYAAEAASLHALIQERAPRARTLLDVACGTGKHLAELRAWYEIAGTDVDPTMIALARKRLGPNVPLREANMVDFDLGRRFDAVTCLFSSVGYVKTVGKLDRAVGAMGRHLAPGGVLVVEPWIFPEAWEAGYPHAVFVDEPDLKLARVNVSQPARRAVVLDLHYLVGTPNGVEYFTEEHELGMFTREEYLAVFAGAGLDVSYDADGLTGRGLFVGLASRGA